MEIIISIDLGHDEGFSLGESQSPELIDSERIRGQIQIQHGQISLQSKFHSSAITKDNILSLTPGDLRLFYYSFFCTQSH